jgi:hypothetical protein
MKHHVAIVIIEYLNTLAIFSSAVMDQSGVVYCRFAGGGVQRSDLLKIGPPAQSLSRRPFVPIPKMSVRPDNFLAPGGGFLTDSPLCRSSESRLVFIVL